MRTICPDCTTQYTPDSEELGIDFPKINPFTNQAPEHLFKGAGCRACRNSGYRGRTGIHELLINSDVVKDLIVQRVNSGIIRMEGLKQGMRTLRQDGFYKALRGGTTLDEVNRATAGDIS